MESIIRLWANSFLLKFIFSRQDQFDLSSDEEDHNTTIFQPLPIKNDMCQQNKENSDSSSPRIACQCLESNPNIDLPGSNEEKDSGYSDERKDSTITDDKFNLLLASLQSLAIEIERDFQNESHQDYSLSRTQSESKLTSSDYD